MSSQEGRERVEISGREKIEILVRSHVKDIPSEPRRLAVVSFRLNTEHDILGKHLSRLGILPSPACILCHKQEDMDRQHLAKCPALKSSKEVDRYWEARVPMDEVTGEWRKLHNTELHALYSSPDIIRNIRSRRLRLAGHDARMDESRNAYRVFVGRPEEKRPLGRPRRRWEGNIKMDLREVGYDGRDWINLPQNVSTSPFRHWHRFTPPIAITKQTRNLQKSIFYYPCAKQDKCSSSLLLKKSLVQTHVFPYFDYADILLTDLSSHNKTKLQRAHNLCVRFVSNVRKYDHITPSLEAIGWLKLDKKRKEMKYRFTSLSLRNLELFYFFVPVVSLHLPFFPPQSEYTLSS
ncbi:hypothetical protein ANN_22082 [Periplaneta americana]|uniref:Reverse transcriptase n=1 Tax=Periplaneta americana TaxID=6978 RepID=A0ABQ8S7G1_PERAM|nr:hypothetical protein ANN_22082 [Periplaneta americana]